ncbi:MAG: citramalate synthase [Clostridiales bacterium]|nr:citramalate synthase [Clostridiales bacterium]
MKRLEIFDSILRDGAQSEGISFSVQDKLKIVRTLDEFGVAYIEAGNPSSNPKDIEFFQKASQLKLKTAKLCAFGSTRRKNMRADDDENVLSLLGANTPAVAIFGKSWDLHATEILKVSLEENLRMVSETVAFLKSNGKELIFDAEHFFDGYKANPGYALEVLGAAADSGADVLCLCDTNGGAFPEEIYTITKEICEKFPSMRIGIHCHNDVGCAVANSMMAVSAGAVQVQGTFIGFGERCGNADLSVLIPNLQLKLGYHCIEGDMRRLSDMVAKVADISNLSVGKNRPYVGESAFAHKGGMHIDGVTKLSRSFEHINPKLVGNRRRFLLSEVSGRTTLLAKIRDIAPQLTKDSPEVVEIMKQLKQAEHEGYQYESADASLELFVLKVLGKYKPHFSLVMYKTTGEYPAPNSEQTSSAMINIHVDGKHETSASLGNGPVHALDSALRKALLVFYPQLHKMQLIDYKVRVLEADHATSARVRVLIESSDGEHVWTTVGVSTDIIQASWIALADSFEYMLAKTLTEEDSTWE